MKLSKVGYCDRRIALWTKYKTDLAIRMLPSEVRGRSGSHSGSMISSAMTRAIGVAMKPRSRAASQSRSRVESSVYIDGDKDKEKPPGSAQNSVRTIDVTPRDPSNHNPYSSNKDAVGSNASALLHSSKNSQRKDNNSTRSNLFGGSATGVAKSTPLGTIQSGNLIIPVISLPSCCQGSCC